MLFKRKEKGVLEDGEIIRLYFDRNEDAIAETDKKYGAMLESLADNILHDKSDGEECRNETYLAVWNSIPPERPESFRAYLAVIMRNKAVTRYYKNKRKKEVPSSLTVSLEECGDILSDGASPEDETLAKELGAIISDFLRALPDRSRFIFLERFWFAEPVKKIAREVGMGESAVYKELTRTKEKLKEFLREKGVKI